MPTTANHDIEIPPARDEQWAAKIERNLEQFETTIPLCEPAGRLDAAVVDDPHTPHDGAWVLARDTGGLFVGDGSEWVHRGGVPRTTDVSTTGDGSTTAFTFGHGLGTEPAWVGVTPTSEAAGQPHHVDSSSATDITVEYADPPADGAALTWELAAIAGDGKPGGVE